MRLLLLLSETAPDWTPWLYNHDVDRRLLPVDVWSQVELGEVWHRDIVEYEWNDLAPETQANKSVPWGWWIKEGVGHTYNPQSDKVTFERRRRMVAYYLDVVHVSDLAALAQVSQDDDGTSWVKLVASQHEWFAGDTDENGCLCLMLV